MEGGAASPRDEVPVNIAACGPDAHGTRSIIDGRRRRSSSATSSSSTASAEPARPHARAALQPHRRPRRGARPRGEKTGRREKAGGAPRRVGGEGGRPVRALRHRRELREGRPQGSAAGVEPFSAAALPSETACRRSVSRPIRASEDGEPGGAAPGGDLSSTGSAMADKLAMRRQFLALPQSRRHEPAFYWQAWPSAASCALPSGRRSVKKSCSLGRHARSVPKQGPAVRVLSGARHTAITQCRQRLIVSAPPPAHQARRCIGPQLSEARHELLAEACDDAHRVLVDADLMELVPALVKANAGTRSADRRRRTCTGRRCRSTTKPSG